VTARLDSSARWWHALNDADLARLRASLVEDLVRLDRERRPFWVWHKQYLTLLEVKRACALARLEEL